MTASPARYFASPAVNCRRWADELVAYDSQRARTHLLSSIAAEVLAQVSRSSGGSALAELEVHLFAQGAAGETPSQLSQEERSSLQAIVVELTQLGLLEARPT